MEPVALVAHPFVRIGVVGIVAEERITLAEHLRRIGLVGLPLGGLFPDGLSVPYRQMKPRADGRR